MISIYKMGKSVSARWITTYAGLVLASAYIFEYGFGYKPCVLCTYQRIVWVAVIVFSCLSYCTCSKPASKYSKLFLGLTFFTLAFSVALAVFHAGVEYSFWQGLKECAPTTTLASDGASLLNSLKTETAPSCQEAPWRLFGISMAGYNALVSMDALLLSVLVCLSTKTVKLKSEDV